MATQKENTPDLKALDEPFQAHQISMKPIAVSKKTGKALAAFYTDARAVQERLDEVVGKAGWQTKYTKHGQGNLCSLGIYINGAWVWKEDGADDTDIESTKGGISSAFRRAASAWGVGRYHYDAPDVWLPYDGRHFVNERAAIEAYVKGSLEAYAKKQKAPVAQTAQQTPAPAPQTDAKPQGNGKTPLKKKSPQQAKGEMVALLKHRLGEVGLGEDWIPAVVAASLGQAVKDPMKVSYNALVKAGQMLGTVRGWIKEETGKEGRDAQADLVTFYNFAVGGDGPPAWGGHDQLEEMYGACFPDRQVPA